MTTDLRQGQVWQHKDDPKIFARIDEIRRKSVENDRPSYNHFYKLVVLFSVWDKRHPGWQGGAGMDAETFVEIYPTNAENLLGTPSPRATKPPKVRITLTYEFTPNPETYPDGDVSLESVKDTDEEYLWDLLMEGIGTEQTKVTWEEIPGER